ncbi:MAG TPA: ABC transporter substrate-binding protein, partial [Gemmatimonadaceae bacterium]
MHGRRVLSITLPVFFLLSACSSDKHVGGTIVLSSAADADILFPPLTLTLMGKQVSDQVFDNLADIGPSLNTVGDAGFTPRLADRWHWAADSQSVAFHLNPRARWHDGVPVSAEDVRYTFQLVKDTSLASPLGSNLDNVDSVSVRDSLTAVVWFHRRTPDAFFKAASPVVILPAHLLRQTAPAALHESVFARAPVGSGRFRFATWDRGARIVLRADSGNYRGRPIADQAIWLVAPDYQTASVRFLAGTADFLDVVKPDVIPLARAKGADIIVTPGSLDYGYAAFNLRNAKNTGPHPIFGDRETRRALVMAVDRSAIVRNVFDTLGLVAHGPATRIMPTSDTTIGIRYDPEQAARTLDSLGWKRGADGLRSRGKT